MELQFQTPNRKSELCLLILRFDCRLKLETLILAVSGNINLPFCIDLTAIDSSRSSAFLTVLDCVHLDLTLVLVLSTYSIPLVKLESLVVSAVSECPFI